MSMKKKYVPPLVTDPESGKPGFTPMGATGCSSGDIGSACSNGTEPQGGPAKCQQGNQPQTLNCNNGTTALESCLNGTDAVINCDIGSSFPGDCTRGSTPLGPMCGSGSSASKCSSGSGGGA